MPDDKPPIGDKIPPIFKPIIQQVIGAIVTAALLWLVGQGVLKPTNERLESQTQQIIEQNKTLKAQLQMQENEAAYWSIPVTGTRK